MPLGGTGVSPLPWLGQSPQELFFQLWSAGQARARALPEPPGSPHSLLRKLTGYVPERGRDFLAGRIKLFPLESPQVVKIIHLHHQPPGFPPKDHLIEFRVHLPSIFSRASSHPELLPWKQVR